MRAQALLLVFAAVACSASPDKPNQGLGTTCNETDSCAEGLSCQNEVCLGPHAIRGLAAWLRGDAPMGVLEIAVFAPDRFTPPTQEAPTDCATALLRASPGTMSATAPVPYTVEGVPPGDYLVLGVVVSGGGPQAVPFALEAVTVTEMGQMRSSSGAEVTSLDLAILGNAHVDCSR